MSIDNFPQIAKNVVLKVIIEKLVIVYYNFIIKMVIVITIVLKISKFYVQIVMLLQILIEEKILENKCVETIHHQPKSLLIWLRHSPDYNAFLRLW